MRSRLFLTILVPALITAVTGCTVGDDPRDVGTAKLEKQLAAGLQKQVGQRPDSVSCPDPLPAKKGAKVRCTLTAGSDKLGITVTTTSVGADGQVDFSFAVDGS